MNEKPLYNSIVQRLFSGGGKKTSSALVATLQLRCVWKATPSASRQLPREGAVYHKIHVVGEYFSAADFFSMPDCPGGTTKGSLARELSRAAGARLRELPSIRTIPEQANPSLSYQKNLLSLIYYLLSKKSFFSPSRPDFPPIFPPPPPRKKSELCLHAAAPRGILNAESGLGGGNK